jgi:hypothetical protein
MSSVAYLDSSMNELRYSLTVMLPCLRLVIPSSSASWCRRVHTGYGNEP